jgi:hypothetical protein
VERFGNFEKMKNTKVGSMVGKRFIPRTIQ